jgi:GMP synthase (glutamine-hydrolysing)
MKIGILATGHAPDSLKTDLGDYPAMFTTLLDGHGFTFETWDIENQQFPQSVSQADGWLITGSRHGVYENHPWIKPLETFVGHQIIAQALGGTVTKFSGGWNIGHTDYTFEGAPLALNAWHQDQVTQIPADARVIGQNNFCENAFLLYGNRAFTLQAHPEFEAEFIEGLARTRAPGVVPTDLIEAAYQALDNPIQNQVIAKRIADFFKLKRP